MVHVSLHNGASQPQMCREQGVVDRPSFLVLFSTHAFSMMSELCSLAMEFAARAVRGACICPRLTISVVRFRRSSQRIGLLKEGLVRAHGLRRSINLFFDAKLILI